MDLLSSAKEAPIYVSGLKERRLWKRDDVACYVCQKYFNKYRRKHNCRVCGELVCDSCTEHQQLVVVRGRGVTNARVCFACVIHATDDDDDVDTPAATFGAMSPARPSFDLPSRHHHSSSPAPRDRSPPLASSNVSSSGAPPPEWGYPWPSPPIVPDEAQRLRELYKLNILDSPSDDTCDIMCETAAMALETSVAAISFIDADRQWFKARLGLLQTFIARHVSLCAPLLVTKTSIAIPDLQFDAHFQHNPLVTGAAAIRFYAAAPVLVNGHVVGTVFVFDQYPRSPGACERARETLENVATSVELYLEDCQLSMEQSRPQDRRRSVTFGPSPTLDNRMSTAMLEDDASDDGIHMRAPSTTILESDASPHRPRRADRTFDSIDTTAVGDMSEGTSFPTTDVVLPSLQQLRVDDEEEEKQTDDDDDVPTESRRGVLEALESGEVSLRLLDLLTISARTQQQVATMAP
ncbi:hypothetical protein SPRG_19031 [Saprolegnia parasitica CBS 223.65]|uniref:FYVE-type domain-containing protein n=1 Tax=Saprolegnia parasitica (strain CBS 223.65) TaxID=695850 RepID=A0A067CY84_SAPPC|nr:hypothetical protein SPRG_19031 [Saprolegnia parasitica CBS 223.65]KDO34185.1 hypothetical protein SPRG_19031 [Saprolegnia parasitica CBS 223.65]|eukprot:XP_012195230.1 hypothetical protein SPRG_19031 [Saprolegnia parasitica CBS 223.65]